VINAGDDTTWRPDPRTVGWVLSNIDESAVGRDVIEQLRRRIPALIDADAALLGEAAVECVLMRVHNMAIKAQNVVPGEPV
jgi:hypothetical protein